MKRYAKFPRLMIAGTGSGCGKTAVACGILGALKNRGLRAAAFKCGPDYIDPMFHSAAAGAESRNLDLFLCGENPVKYLFAQDAAGADVAVVEGAMGFYDGLGVKTSEGSACDLACRTGTPVLLVVGCRGMSVSAAAMVKGFVDFGPNGIKAVIFNGLSPGVYPFYKELIESRTPVKALGFLPKLPQAAVESRHLGLVTAGEIAGLSGKLDLLARNAEKYIDLGALMKIARAAPGFAYDGIEVKKRGAARVAVARDRAFCFYYRDSLGLLERMGAELVPFSPLSDSRLPEGADGLILGGGYPELYARELAENVPMRESIRAAVKSGLPTVAECGGFLYLHETLTDARGGSFPMAGAVKGGARMTEKLRHFGYVTLTARRANLLCGEGETINAHEFHYSESDDDGDLFTAEKPVLRTSWPAVRGGGTLCAGYPHFHFWGNPGAAANFLSACVRRRAARPA